MRLDISLTRCGLIRPSGIVLLAVLGLVGSHGANAGGITINTPAGLNPGDTFRIAFVTDASYFAVSSDIEFYNSFVNNDATLEAGGGAVTYNGTVLTFSAIASTIQVEAINNIGHTGAPVYLASGTELAVNDLFSSGGLWGGQLLVPLQSDLNQNIQHGKLVWTGTWYDGLALPLYGLGSQVALCGTTDSPTTDWISMGFDRTSDSVYRFYGISQPITVPAPEPSSIVLAMLGGCGAVGAIVRRRRAGRRERSVYRT